MVVSLLPLFFLLLADGAVGAGQCGTQAPNLQPSAKPRARIIGGSEAIPHTWPWMALLIYNVGSQYHQCGGNLIRVSDKAEESDILVTAAHCVSQRSDNGYITLNPLEKQQAILGSHRRGAATPYYQVRTYDKVVMHPDYKYPGSYVINDIAIVKLNRSVKFTDGIRPICLPAANEPIPVGKTCVSAGWGVYSDQSSNLSPVLKQLYLPVHDAKTCREGTPEYSENYMICAGGMYNEDTSSPCRGDSGGMLVCRDRADQPWVLQGTVSWGTYKCVGHRNKPEKFARVSSYVKFITDTARSLTSIKG